MDDKDKNTEQPATDTQRIINLLQQFSSAGLNFEEAKQKMISQGYSEESINAATDDYQYGSKQVSDIPTQVTEYFQAHPEQALADGASLLAAKRKEDLADAHNQAILDMAAAQAAAQFGAQGIDAEVEYKSKFAADVGISFWLLTGLGFVVSGAVCFLTYWFHLTGWFYAINGLASLTLMLLLIKRSK